MSKRRANENWDEFRYFLAVARAGTLSRAADRLGTDHTTVARHIQFLEEDLNQKLFHRSNSGYELTEAGQRLSSAAEVLESAFISARAAPGQDTNVISGTVRVAAPDGFGTMYLAPRLAALTNRYPGLEIELLATARLFSLSKREADIAIGLSRAEHMRVVSRRLTDYKLFLYGARSYLRKRKPVIEKADLRGHQLIGYIEESVFTQELNHLSNLGEDIDARIRSTNLLAQVHATLSGSGLCILPVFIGALYQELIPVLTKEIAITHTFHMHIHEDHRQVSHIREVATFIASEVTKDHALFFGDAENRRLLSKYQISHRDSLQDRNGIVPVDTIAMQIAE
jgi:DNA-binding transcriptional LysR family regulator